MCAVQVRLPSRAAGGRQAQPQFAFASVPLTSADLLQSAAAPVAAAAAAAAADVAAPADDDRQLGLPWVPMSVRYQHVPRGSHWFRTVRLHAPGGAASTNRYGNGALPRPVSRHDAYVSDGEEAEAVRLALRTAASEQRLRDRAEQQRLQAEAQSTEDEDEQADLVEQPRRLTRSRVARDAPSTAVAVFSHVASAASPTPEVVAPVAVRRAVQVFDRDQWRRTTMQRAHVLHTWQAMQPPVEMRPVLGGQTYCKPSALSAADQAAIWNRAPIPIVPMQ